MDTTQTTASLDTAWLAHSCLHPTARSSTLWENYFTKPNLGRADKLSPEVEDRKTAEGRGIKD